MFTVTNSAPILASAIPDQAGQVGYAFSFDATQSGNTFSDPDSDTLSVTVSFSADIGLSASDGTISGTPGQPGDITVTVEAADPDGASVSDSFVLSVGIDQDAVLAAFGANIDLAALANYANQPVPTYIGPPLDDGNPVTDKGATLGRILFYDAKLSIDNSVSCSSCHVQANGFSDLATVSSGVGSGVTGRHSMRLINGGFGHDGPGGGATTQFWDQRAASHAEQETMLDHYSNIPTPGGEPARTDLLNTLDGRLRQGNQVEQFNLSNAEKDAIEAFLRTLSGSDVYTDPKWSDPF